MNKWRKAMAVLFAVYIVFVLWLLLARQRDILSAPYWQHTVQHINLFPLRTIRLYWKLLMAPGRPDLQRLAILNLAGNVILFIPLGFLLPELFPGLRRFYRTILAACTAVIAAEVLQMLLLVGTCDVDDLLLNAAGAALGYLLFRFLHS